MFEYHSLPLQVENVKEVLQLSAEQKGALVAVGELTVLLNKPSTAAAQDELAALTNGSADNSTSEFYGSVYKQKMRWRYLLCRLFDFSSRSQAQR